MSILCPEPGEFKRKKEEKKEEKEEKTKTGISSGISSGPVGEVTYDDSSNGPAQQFVPGPAPDPSKVPKPWR